MQIKKYKKIIESEICMIEYTPRDIEELILNDIRKKGMLASKVKFKTNYLCIKTSPKEIESDFMTYFDGALAEIEK